MTEPNKPQPKEEPLKMSGTYQAIARDVNRLSTAKLTAHGKVGLMVVKRHLALLDSITDSDCFISFAAVLANVVREISNHDLGFYPSGTAVKIASTKPPLVAVLKELEDYSNIIQRLNK